MTLVRAPSRLHFGLLSLPISGGECWPDGMPMRQFGGVGLMIDDPGVAVRITPASKWSAHGPNAERALAFARTFSATLPVELQQCFSLVIEHSPAGHTGLGSGTALALAVAKGIVLELGNGAWPSVELACRVGRGERSAIGVHGFDLGGLIVEAGKLPGERIAPLIGRWAFPAEWRIVLIRPYSAANWHGQQERQAFATLPKNNATETLCRLVMTGLLPALALKNLDLFGEALHEYNARAGEGFTAAQGGIWAGPEVAECVGFLRREGIHGVGQSSWGPTVFAVVEDEVRAKELRIRIGKGLGIAVQDIGVTRASEDGAKVAQAL